MGTESWVLKQDVVVTSQIIVKTRQAIDPETVNLIWFKRLPVLYPLETHCIILI